MEIQDDIRGDTIFRIENKYIYQNNYIINWRWYGFDFEVYKTNNVMVSKIEIRDGVQVDEFMDINELESRELIYVKPYRFP